MKGLHETFVRDIIGAGQRQHRAECRDCTWFGATTTDKTRANTEATAHETENFQRPPRRSFLAPVPDPIVIEATNTTQGGRPVVRVDGDLYVVTQELES